jgi:hypothetical protein
VLRPALQQRRIREAARVVNLALSTAHSQAIQTGRGHGVLFERNKNLPQACTTLRQVEVPPPYTGDVTGAAVKILAASGGGGSFTVMLKVRSTDVSNGVIRPGDRIRFNYQGPTYVLGVGGTVADPEFPTDPAPQLFLPDANGYYQFDGALEKGPQATWDGFLDTHVLVATVADANDIPWSGTAWSMPIPFTIERQWVSSSAPPVVLPGQTAIDLCFSGEENLSKAYAPGFGANSPNDTVPVVVLFSPSGSLKELSVNGNQIPPLGSVFFLVGQRDRVPLSNTANSPAEDGRANIADANNLWVTVAPQSGLVTTSPVDDDTDARKTAREQERMGGN